MSAASIANMHQGDHYCGIYRSDEDQRAVVRQFVRDGIARHEKVLYVVNVHTAAALRDELAAAGFDVDGLIRDGQLTILTAKDAYLNGGDFDPQRMVALIEAEMARADEQGFAGLRVTAEMTWALAGEPGSERLIEYESLVNRVISGRRCAALCQYDRRRFDAEVLLDVLHTHPKVLFGTEAFDNRDRYFVPPDGFLGADRQGAMFDTWIRNLAGSELDRG